MQYDKEGEIYFPLFLLYFAFDKLGRQKDGRIHA